MPAARGSARRTASGDRLPPFRGAFRQSRVGVGDARPQHAPRTESLAQVARAGDGLLVARAVGGKKPDLPAARGLDLEHVDRTRDDAADVRPLFERPAHRPQQRGGLTRRWEDRALETQRPGVLALEANRDAQGREPVGCERRGDLVQRGAQREDELLARWHRLLPHATRADATRRRRGRQPFLVFGTRERVCARGTASEAIEHRAARERRELSHAAQAEQRELVDERRVDGQHAERKRSEVVASIRHQTRLAGRGALGRDPRYEGRGCHADRCRRAEPTDTLSDATRDVRGRTQHALGAGEIARVRTTHDHAYVRKHRPQRDENAGMKRLARVADDDGRDHAVASVRSARIPRSLGSTVSAFTQKSAWPWLDDAPAANDQPTGSTRTVGSATRLPRSSATTRSAAGEPRTTGSSGATSSTTHRDANDGPRSTTTRRKPSLRSAAEPARSTSYASVARTTTTRSRSMPARDAASGSSDADGSIHATIPPSRCAAAATRIASASLPAVAGPTNASGSPARMPPPVTWSSEVPDAIRRSASRRSATSPRATARVPYLVSMRVMASARAVAPTARSPCVPRQLEPGHSLWLLERMF